MSYQNGYDSMQSHINTWGKSIHHPDWTACGKFVDFNIVVAQEYIEQGVAVDYCKGVIDAGKEYLKKS